MERRFTLLVIDILEQRGEMNPVVLSLLNYLSDDDVYDWAISNGYLDPDDE